MSETLVQEMIRRAEALIDRARRHPAENDSEWVQTARLGRVSIRKDDHLMVFLDGNAVINLGATGALRTFNAPGFEEALRLMRRGMLLDDLADV